MRVEIQRLTDWNIALNAARFTVNKNDIGKEPSSEFKAKILKAEHSPIRMIVYSVKMYDVPSWVSQHLARHDAFAWHTVRESGETHFVATQRTDRTGVNRDELPQSAPVNHSIFLNAQDFITISRRRLCKCASKETVSLWKAVLNELKKTDEEVYNSCVPECVYRGFCPEVKSCGWVRSKEYQEQRNKYTL